MIEAEFTRPHRKTDPLTAYLYRGSYVQPGGGFVREVEATIEWHHDPAPTITGRYDGIDVELSLVGEAPGPTPLPKRPSSHSDHWLLFRHFPDEQRVKIMGCHCGFRADLEEDAGYGDTVVDHLIEVGVEWAEDLTR